MEETIRCFIVVICVLFAILFFSFSVHFLHFACVVVYSPVPPLSLAEQSPFFIHVYVHILVFIKMFSNACTLYSVF